MLASLLVGWFVCLSVEWTACFLIGWLYGLFGLSAGLHKNYWMDFHKTWVEDRSALTFGADPDKGMHWGIISLLCEIQHFLTFCWFIEVNAHIVLHNLRTNWCILLLKCIEHNMHFFLPSVEFFTLKYWFLPNALMKIKWLMRGWEKRL